MTLISIWNTNDKHKHCEICGITLENPCKYFECTPALEHLKDKNVSLDQFSNKKIQMSEYSINDTKWNDLDWFFIDLQPLEGKLN